MNTKNISNLKMKCTPQFEFHIEAFRFLMFPPYRPPGWEPVAVVMGSVE